MQRTKRLEAEIGGQIRPLLFDFTFLDHLVDIIPLAELDNVGKTKPWRLIPAVALAGLQSGASFEGKKEKFDLPTVTGWVEDMDGLKANEILECYKTAMGFMNLALAGAAE